MLEHLARLGYASKALIYGIVSVLATLTAVNRGGSITDTSGALRVVLSQPFGRTLLVVVAVGLCGYGLWRWLDAIADPDHEGTTLSGVMVRIGKAVRGTVYGALALEAIRLLRGFRRAAGDPAELWTARLIGFPFGEVAVGSVGAIIAVTVRPRRFTPFAEETIPSWTGPAFLPASGQWRGWSAGSASRCEAPSLRHSARRSYVRR